MTSGLRHYAVVTGAYWSFTVTDGALRMLVLLHLHELGRSALEIASLFLFYEVFGVVTNFLGGWIGSRFGLKSTLIGGLSLQIAALAMMLVDPSRLTIPWLIASQSLSGVAKDLTKMSSKSFVKLVLPEGDSRRLMKWVAVLTGSKNALKGAGFFLGGLLLGLAGFRGACLALMGLVALGLVTSSLVLPRASGRTGHKVGLLSVFSRDARINWLAAARLFLFGSRDAWFVLALPLFLSTVLGWSFEGVGAFLAFWVVGYGIVQAATPRLLSRAAGSVPDARRLGAQTALLIAPLGGILLALRTESFLTTGVVAGLVLFGVVFAVNSAVHSYLIVAYAESEKVALRVGFYYTANALGRLFGTLLSGSLFQLAAEPTVGLANCILASIALVVLSALSCWPLRRAEARQAAPGFLGAVTNPDVE